jgi:signal transduction histidine kinase
VAAKSAEEDLHRFCKLLSHELRGPAGLLKGYLAMLSDGTLGDLPDQARTAVDVSYQQSARLCGMLEHLLLALQLREDRVAPRRRLVDLASWLEGRVGEMEPATQLRVEAGPVRAELDTELIGTALLNLIENAARVTPFGGAVRVCLRPRDGRALIDVSDQGPGLPAGCGQGLFGEGQESRGRLGLGLFIVRRIAELHGGWLDLDSTPGGLTARLNLPLGA